MRADRLLAAILPLGAALVVGACSVDLAKVFDRPDPRVEEARGALEASIATNDADLAAARMQLEEVLQWRCETDGGKDLVVERPNASVDLGLLLFRISELVGRRFGEEEMMDAEGEEAEGIAAARAAQLDCAHLLLLELANDPATPKDIALRARYLLGNFQFLSRRYKEAIAEYDEVLLAHPARGDDPPGEVGAPKDDDAVARDAAWNRAIALKRLHDRDAGADADSGQDGDADGDAGDADADGRNDGEADVNETPEAGPDSDAGEGGNDADGGRDTAPDGNDAGDKGQDSGGDAQNKGDTESKGEAGDGGIDAQTNPPPPQPSASASPPPAPSTQVDLRELDRFDKKSPLDLDLPQKFKERKSLPKGLDK